MLGVSAEVSKDVFSTIWCRSEVQANFLVCSRVLWATETRAFSGRGPAHAPWRAGHRGRHECLLDMSKELNIIESSIQLAILWLAMRTLMQDNFRLIYWLFMFTATLLANWMQSFSI